MPKTLTLRNIPDAVYERLKASAQENRRSMNSEAIVRLESALPLTTLTPGDQLVHARALRAALAPAKFRVRDIDAFKRASHS